MKPVKKWILLASSSIMYGLALMFSQWFWWGSFIFLAPLFYLVTQKNVSFKEGFIYGALLWGLGGFGILKSLYTMGSGPFYIRLAPLVFIVVFQALFAGLWFWGTTKILTKLTLSSRYFRVGVWVITTALYFQWVIRYSLSLFNAWEGYFLMHPMLPLAEHPALFSWMPFLGKGLLGVVLLLTNAAWVVPFLISRKKIAWVVPFIGMLPWVASALLAPPSKTPPSWVAKVFAMPHMHSYKSQITSVAQAIQNQIQEILKEHPDTELIIWPESSLNRVNLSTAQELGYYWSSEKVSKPVNIVIGAFNWEDATYRNTAYWFYDGKLKSLFNKRHAMAVTEGIRGWYNIPLIKSLYYTSEHPVVIPSANKREPWQIVKEVSFIPYICSELFFNDSPDDEYPESVILALCNDNWSSSAYIRRLMFLAARFKAIEWQRQIVYVAYYHSGFIDTDGSISKI